MREKKFARLDGIQRRLDIGPNLLRIDLNCQLKSDFQNVLNQEVNFGATKSMTKCIAYGDKNTKFYHRTTLIIRSHGRIGGIKDQLGN